MVSLVGALIAFIGGCGGVWYLYEFYMYNYYPLTLNQLPDRLLKYSFFWTPQLIITVSSFYICYILLRRYRIGKNVRTHTLIGFTLTGAVIWFLVVFGMYILLGLALRNG